MIISVSITESDIQLVNGIPQTITITANIPCTIFYTFDGTTPDINTSSVYVGPLTLPTNQNTLVVNIFATNGTDNSGVITRTYTPDVSQLRLPHATVSGLSNFAEAQANSYPFGGASIPVPVRYGNIGGLTVNAAGSTIIPDGYDSDGNISQSGTDLPLTNYELVFSETNAEGERGHGIGNLPAQVKIRTQLPGPNSTYSKTSSPSFNPKATVIFQDSSEPPFDPGVAYINHQFFTTTNSETTRDGAATSVTGFEGLSNTGTFLRQFYDATTNTITYYYFDSGNNKWIISKEPYTPKANGTTDLSRICFNPRDQGVGKVYKWIPFKGKHL